ncbi:ribonuclease H-like domain-containing protein [Penicillium malachiteum]|uniref:ribonuclease H n=1 Tax=Penicillium malachiteum TaxID=1324776 RepID=A0AAD6N0A4_9EURO|nr:ribonuclease H-like domain-containing protein [Penicillium malachiteum]
MDLTNRLSIDTGRPIPKKFITLDGENIVDHGITWPKKRLRIGTGHLIPKKFVPPDDETTPQHLFPAGPKYLALPPVERFIHRRTPSIFLVYTDGLCLGNGGRNPKAGCSIVFRPDEDSKGNRISSSFRFALENKGPRNDDRPQTSNRAELRAAIAACQFRAWTEEGFTTMVIAMDSEYVVEGITTWIDGWIRRDWKTTKGQLVKNWDLWECLLGEIEMADEEGLDIQFWRIPRELNTDAGHYAGLAAAELERNDNFTKYCGVLV